MVNNNMPKEWKELLPETVISFIEMRVPEKKLFWALNKVLGYQDITHKKISNKDLEIIKRLIKEYL